MYDKYRNAMEIGAKDPHLFAKVSLGGLVSFGIVMGYAAVPLARWAYHHGDPLTVIAVSALLLSAIRIVLNVAWVKRTAHQVTAAINSTNAQNDKRYCETSWEAVAANNPLPRLVTILATALGTATAALKAPAVLDISPLPDS